MNGYKILVRLTDGKWLEFRAFDSYESHAQGRLLAWQDVTLDGKFYSWYSIPTSKVEEIMEIDLDEED